MFCRYPVSIICISCLATAICGCSRPSASLIESTGTIEATEVDIRTEVSGKVVALYCDEGDQVKRGDLLAQIDQDKRKIQLAQAKARLAEAEAQLALLIRGLREKEVERSREEMLESQILLKESKREYLRLQHLYDKGVIDLGSRDKAETGFESARRRCAVARKNYQIALEGSREEEIQAGEAAREAARAQVRLIERQIADASITSPIDGVISERYVESGELVSVGGLIATVIDLKHVWVMAYVSEKNLGKVQLQQWAMVRVDSFPRKKFVGRITYLSPEAEFTPKNIQTREERVKLVFGVKIEIDNPNHELKPGMPADAIIVSGQ